MLLHGIDYNILIYYPSYSGVYQDEENKRALQRDKYFLGLEPNQENWQNCGKRLSINIVFDFIIPLSFWMGIGCSGIIFFKNQNIDGETYTAKWVVFLSVFLLMIKRLLVCSSLDAYFATTHNLMALGNIS